MPIGSTDFGMGITFVLEDAFTSVATKISNSFKGMKGTFDKGAIAINNGLNKVRDSLGTLAVAGAAAFALAAPFVMAVNASAELSDALADVTKTTGISGSALQNLKHDLEDIDTRTSIEGLLEMAKAGGQMGVAQKDIAGFTNAVDKLNVALGDQFASPEELARDLTKLRNVLGDIKSDNIEEDLLHIGNALNFMGANAAAQEKNIAEMVSRMSGLGQELGATSPQLFGLATAMDELGVGVEVAGSNIPIIMQKMASGYGKFAEAIGVNANEFKKLVNEDVVGALTMFSKKLKQQHPTATGMSQALGDLGLNGARVSQVFLKLGSSSELVEKRITQAGIALEGTGSIMDEFNAKNTTLAAVLEKAQKSFKGITTDIGDALAPAVLFLAAGLEKVFKFVRTLAQTFTGKLLIGLSALVAGFTALAIVGAALMPILTSLSVAFGGAWVAALGPIALIIAGIAAIGFAVEGVMSKFDAFADENIMKRNMGSGLDLLLLKVGGVGSAIVEIFKTATSEGFSMSSKMASALQELGILDFVLSLGTWIVRIKEFFRGVMDVALVLWDSFKNVFGAIFDAVGEVVDSMGLFEDGMDKAGGSMDIWRAAGQGIALFFQGTLIPILEVVSFMIRFVGKVIATVFSMFDGKIGTTTDLLKSFIDLFVNTFDRFQEIGSSFSDGIGSLFGMGGEDNVAMSDDGSGASGGISSVGKSQAKAQANIANQRPTVVSSNSTEVREVSLNIDLGSEKITKSVNLQNDFEDSRE